MLSKTAKIRNTFILGKPSPVTDLVESILKEYKLEYIRIRDLPADKLQTLKGITIYIECAPSNAIESSISFILDDPIPSVNSKEWNPNNYWIQSTVSSFILLMEDLYDIKLDITEEMHLVAVTSTYLYPALRGLCDNINPTALRIYRKANLADKLNVSTDIMESILVKYIEEVTNLPVIYVDGMMFKDGRNYRYTNLSEIVSNTLLLEVAAYISVPVLYNEAKLTNYLLSALPDEVEIYNNWIRNESIMGMNIPESMISLH